MRCPDGVADPYRNAFAQVSGYLGPNLAGAGGCAARRRAVRKHGEARVGGAMTERLVGHLDGHTARADEVEEQYLRATVAQRSPQRQRRTCRWQRRWRLE